jgi:hypothetical protein
MRWKACRSRYRRWPTPWERSARRSIRSFVLSKRRVMAAERLHGDDTTVPVLALGKCDVARCWVYVKDDRPFGGSDSPAAMFYYSRDRRGEHPQAHLANYSGILQADAFGGYTKLYEPQRSPGPIREAACWVHARRPFFTMADLEENARRKAAGKKEIALSPIAIEIVRRIDALFAIERSVVRHVSLLGKVNSQKPAYTFFLTPSSRSVAYSPDETPNHSKNQKIATLPLIRWSIQEVRRIAIRLARKRIQPAYIIAWSLWRRAHQAAAQRSHFKANRQL